MNCLHNTIESNLRVTALSHLAGLIPVQESMTDRWDREWLHYFVTEDPRVFFIDHKQLSLSGSLHNKGPEEVFQMSLCTSTILGDMIPLHIWIDGDALVEKKVLEMGCGPAFLGRQLGFVVESYVGIDYSKLALSIARLTSPSNCHYYHLSELDAILTHAGSIDTMVGREFFIHQNYENLIRILHLASALLKRGGLISADFYEGNPTVPQGVIHPAKSELDPQYASCGYQYSRDEIEEAAGETGYGVVAITDKPEYQRRFVLFQRM